MRKIITLLLIGFVSVGVWGQAATNKIEPTGNVGIGTTNPNQKLQVEDGDVGIGDQSNDNWMRLLQYKQDGFGYDFQHNNASVIINEQGGTNEAIILGDVDSNNNSVLFGVSHKAGNTSWSPKLTLTGKGYLGIGTPNPKEMLSVNGTILAKEVKVSTDASDWPDFVFEPDYNLKPLSEVENYILTNKHLPDIPSAAQMEEQGVNLAKMNKLLLQKVEELTLYQIEKDKEVKKIKEARRREHEERENLKEALSEEQRARGEMEKRLTKMEALLIK